MLCAGEVLGPYCGLSEHGGVSMEKELSGNRSQGASALFAITLMDRNSVRILCCV